MRLIFALWHIPFSRHIHRLINRSRIKVYGLFPALFFKYFKHKADRINVKVPSLNQFANLRAAISHYYSENNFNASVDTNGSLTITVLNEDFSVRICDLPYIITNEGSNELQKMSIGYCGFFAEMVGDLTKNRLHFDRILTSMSSKNCWGDSSLFNSIWHPYCVSHRVINYILLLIRLDEEGLRDTKLYKNLISEIAFCFVFIRSSVERELHYNHYSKNMVSLYLVQCVLGIEIDNAFFSEFTHAIDHQVNLDGMHAELCPMYHRHFSNDLAMLQSVVGPNSVFNTYIQNMNKKMVECSSLMRHKGALSLFGDSWEGEASIPDVPYDSNVVALLNNSGYFVYRDRELSFILDIGCTGPDDNPGHAHADYLHLELYAGETPVFVDYGVPTYSIGHERTYSRSSFAHNGPCLQHRSFLETWSSFRTGRRSKSTLVSLKKMSDSLIVEGVVNPYFDRSFHIYRQITRSEDKIEIKDTWKNLEDRRSRPFSRFIIPNESVCGLEIFEYQSSVHQIDIVGGWVLELNAKESRCEACVYYSEFGAPRNGLALNLIPMNAGKDGVTKVTLTKV